jgi:hypothetical protein
MPQPVPLLGPDGKVKFPITHADAVIDGVNKMNPQFFGSIFLNGLSVFSTQTDPETGKTTTTPLAASAGGTGYSSLDELATELARILGFTSGKDGQDGADGADAVVGIIPIAKGGTGSTTADEALAALGAATAALYTVSIPVSWSDNDSGGYIQTVTVNGIKSTDVPVVGLVMSSDVSAATLQGKAFANVNRITTATNSITLYCFSTKPTTAVTIQLLVVRGF